MYATPQKPEVHGLRQDAPSHVDQEGRREYDPLLPQGVLAPLRPCLQQAPSEENRPMKTTKSKKLTLPATVSPELGFSGAEMTALLRWSGVSRVPPGLERLDPFQKMRECAAAWGPKLIALMALHGALKPGGDPERALKRLLGPFEPVHWMPLWRRKTVTPEEKWTSACRRDLRNSDIGAEDGSVLKDQVTCPKCLKILDTHQKAREKTKARQKAQKNAKAHR
jgi:hypothetical protein